VKWISVNEHMPEPDCIPDEENDHCMSGWVIVWGDTASPMMGYYNYLDISYFTAGWYGINGVPLGTITHWMPLPSPPIEDNPTDTP
jgi:hypothetical protein